MVKFGGIIWLASVAKPENLGLKNRNFFVRKMVCQDDNAPECLPDMGICIQELQMELKIKTEKEEKGFSLTTPALSEDLLEQSRNSECEKWEKWYQNINTTFCPRVSNLLQKKDSLTLRQLVDTKQDRKFSKLLVCRYMTFMKSRKGKPIPDVNSLWQSVCVKRDFLEGTDECSLNARKELGFVSQLSSRCSTVKTAKLLKDDVWFNMTQLESSENSVATTMSPSAEESFRCHEQYESHMNLVLDLKFWLETVVLSVIATFGFFGNIMTFIVLRKQRSRSNFHKMLMTLTVNDSILIIFYLLSSAVIGSLNEAPTWWKLLFPYVFHPLKAVSFSASIFMVVAVSAERYKAIFIP